MREDAPFSDLAVRVVPRSCRNRVEGADGGLKVWVSAPPVEGAANESVCKLVADALGVPPTSLSVVRGAKGRHKTLRIQGLDPGALRERLARFGAS